MEIKKFNIDGNECIFVCESRNTRDGFAHDCTLQGFDGRQFKATCYYLNRTWEKYRYQSVMLKAVNNALKWKLDNITNECKISFGWNKITAKRRADIEKRFKLNLYYKVYNELLNALK